MTSVQTEKILNRIKHIPLQSILQRLPGLQSICNIIYTLTAPRYAPVLFIIILSLLKLCIVYSCFRQLRGIYYTYYECIKFSKIDWAKKYCETSGASFPDDSRYELPYTKVIHVIIIPQYMEDESTIYDTLQVLASHNMAKSNYKV